MPIKKDNSITVMERLFFKTYLDNDCQNLSEAFKIAFPKRSAAMKESSIPVAASKLYDRIKKSLTFKELLELNGIDDQHLVKEGKRLMGLKRPYFGPRGEIVEADDGSTQAKVWDRMTELRGHGTSAKMQVNISGAGPLNISFGEGSLEDDNVEVSLPIPEEDQAPEA